MGNINSLAQQTNQQHQHQQFQQFQSNQMHHLQQNVGINPQQHQNILQNPSPGSFGNSLGALGASIGSPLGNGWQWKSDNFSAITPTDGTGTSNLLKSNPNSLTLNSLNMSQNMLQNNNNNNNNSLQIQSNILGMPNNNLQQQFQNTGMPNQNNNQGGNTLNLNNNQQQINQQNK